MDSLLIIRPRLRWAHRQEATGIALGAALAAGLWLAGSPRGSLVTIVVVGSALLAAIVLQRTLRRRGPRAIVATSDYIGFLSANGDRRVIAWDAVQRAAHSTGFGGMRWKLQSLQGAIGVRDVGVDPEQWKQLWWRVGAEVSARGRPVLVDRISDMLFD